MMMFQQIADSIPIAGIFVAFAIVASAASEAGYRIGVWWQERTPDEKEGPTAMIVVLGSVVTLVFDLDRPRGGFLTVSQQPFADLQRQIGAAVPEQG
ncbi:hypothetical protein Mal15_21550 [Stieleria maiorica]|uniref:Uncharacterized protein n=1 Tax=Stieleria maiorica TaxID=2795974 RepID=A0A5B9MAF5_9BACT|nr:hypothetical protein [Stieleria maiorica]QEF98108.1 hypothetical protein Mal15_21550 [Stieleria maiorica]